MNIYFDEKINTLAKKLDKPLYCVGGYIRNFLIDKSLSSDIDLCAPIKAEELLPALKEVGFTVKTAIKRTGTVIFTDGKNKYEFTSFRKEVYKKGGFHTPENTVFTENIKDDSLRRDFTCNAVYYDIKNKKIVDPLKKGVKDIKNKIINTVCSPKKVFSHDGLRLMRLARFSGELDFIPTKRVLFYAKRYSGNILDISPERIFEELKKILVCDTKYPFSKKEGQYYALKILDKTRTLDNIMPELTKGRGMYQRKDFHNYDVLEHTLRTVRYADISIRLSALLHDVGKPYAMNTDGRYLNHDKYGEVISKEILKRLKADNKTIKEVSILTLYHMVDLRARFTENELKYFIVRHFDIIDKLLLLQQADFSACKDDLSIAPTVKKWTAVIKKMREENVPFSLKELDVSAKDLIDNGIKRENISKTLELLLKKVIFGEIKNKRADLLNYVKIGNI